MAEPGKIPKEALIYSRPTHCNNDLTANYTLKEKRLTVDSVLEKRALNNCYLNQTYLLKENYLQEEVVTYSLGTILGLFTTVENVKRLYTVEGKMLPSG